MVFEEVRSDQCNMTRAPRPGKVAVDPNHGLPAGVLGPVALIGPHLLEKEAAVGVRAENGPRRSLSPRAMTGKRKASPTEKLTSEKNA
jgi:hypothetical protein